MSRSPDGAAGFSSEEKRAMLAQLLKKKIIESRTFPLSFAQQRLWFLDQLAPGSAVYTIPIALCLTGPLSVAALEQSINEVVRRHDVLRTTFSSMQGRPVQIVSPAASVPLPVLDLSDLALPAQEAATARLVAEEARWLFDLARGPLIRAGLLRRAETEHVLLLTIHHIVFDGWSTGILLNELTALYTAFTRRQPSPLPDLPMQYADFVASQQQWLQSEKMQEQLAYWKRQLSGSPPRLDIPAARPRPASQTFRGAWRSFALSEARSRALKGLSRREGVTLFMTLLAAFQLLLARYSGQDDVVVGSPIANRNHADIEGLIGLFVNVLVLRTDLAGNPTVQELLGRVRDTTLHAYDHQDMPFEKLVEELQPERSPGDNPLYQAYFVLQNIPMEPARMPGMVLRPIKPESGTAKYDLDLAINEEGDSLTGVLEYNVELFDAAVIARMLGHYQTLLEGMAADPTQRIAEVSLLTKAERWQLLGEWNDTRKAYRRDVGLHRLFEAQAEQTPDAVAAIYKGEYATYATLNRRANQLAHRLQALGVGPEAPVGVCVERSLKTLTAILGIFKAGGVYVPLDPAYPAAHLAFVLADTRITTLIAERLLEPRLPLHNAVVIRLDASESLAQERASNPANAARPANLAYVMYTSGSTGQPKGVAVAQEQLLKRFAWMWRAYPFAPNEAACQRTTANFTVSMWELLGPLIQGVPIVIVPDEIVADPGRFIQALAEHNITRIVVVPTVLRMLLDSGIDLQRRLPRLKLWSTCGEPLSGTLARRFQEAMPHAVLLNQYGASEVNDIACYDTGAGSGDRLSAPIGRPIDNTRIYLLDRHLHPAPIGVPGELYVGGVGLARGYHNQPALSAERFIPNPFAGIEARRRKIEASDADADQTLSPIFDPLSSGGLRLYKTGDLARYLPDGAIEHLGRRDQQIKLRGIRVELRGIEAVIGQHPAVERAVVAVSRAAPGDDRLVAYVVPRLEDSGSKRAESAPDAAGPLSSRFDPPASILGELRTFLLDRLPPFMIPVRFVFIEALPMTPNGKIDRKALPAPDLFRPELETVYVAPQTPIEQTIAAVWQEVLRVEKVGMSDNFFDLGGHSLLIAQVRSKLQEVLGKDIAMIALFQYPTVGSLANHLSRLQPEPPSFQKTQDRARRHQEAKNRERAFLKGVRKSDE